MRNTATPTPVSLPPVKKTHYTANISPFTQTTALTLTTALTALIIQNIPVMTQRAILATITTVGITATTTSTPILILDTTTSTSTSELQNDFRGFQRSITTEK